MRLGFLFILLLSIFYFLFSNSISAQFSGGGGGGTTGSTTGVTGGETTSGSGATTGGGVTNESTTNTGGGSTTTTTGGGTTAGGNLPQITVISPISGANNEVIDLTIDGSNFSFEGVSVKLTRAGATDIVGSDISVINEGKRVIARFDLVGKLIGDWRLVLTNSNGATANYDSFTVKEPIIESQSGENIQCDSSFGIERIASNAAAYNDPSLNQNPTERLLIKGYGFDEYSYPYLVMGEDYLPPVEAIIIDPRTIVAEFDVTGVPPGEWDLYVYNWCGQYAVFPRAYSIIKGLSKGFFSTVKKSPNISGSKYTIDYLYKWLFGGQTEEQSLPVDTLEGLAGEDSPPSEDRQLVEERYQEDGQYEEYREEYPEQYAEEEVRAMEFNKWIVILTIIKEKLDLFSLKFNNFKTKIF